MMFLKLLGGVSETIGECFRDGWGRLRNYWGMFPRRLASGLAGVGVGVRGRYRFTMARTTNQACITMAVGHPYSPAITRRRSMSEAVWWRVESPSRM